MKRYYRFLPLLVAVTLVACNTSGNVEVMEEESRPQVTESFGEGLSDDALLPMMNIKVTEALAKELESVTGEDGYVKLSETRSFDDGQILSMRRLFPYAGVFEERTRSMGMHLWYVVRYDDSKSMTRASSELELPGVEIVEYCPRIEIVDGGEAVPVEVLSTRASSSSMPFDDPMLNQQWHYYNNGSANSSVSGCDINVFPIWKNYSRYYQYKGDIVVGVVDGGIDYKHDDLKDNMWHNPEKSGENVYGKNFTDNSFIIRPESHGTHVAGTIAAVNNNGIGVCGVAGGDSRTGIKGAKLMSCQIFDGESQGSGAEAIKWSADNGAVISQNSWGYIGATSTPASLKSAVDYFIRYAGVDDKGNQVGPMKGGIVFFASGNDNATTSGNDYEPIVNVTAVAADYKRSYFTNYGPWCDIAAPGGDVKKGNEVLSTLPGNKYGKMQGSSMACPHASGVAALILARFGGSGYTNKALRDRIENNVTDIASQNQNYYLGKGLINTYKAIAGSGGLPPETPSGLAASARSNNVNFTVTVPRDPDDGTPSSIFIYYSTTDFSQPSDAMFGMFYVEDADAGSTLGGRLTGLDFNTTYYLAAMSSDLAGNKSSLSKKIKVTTGENNPPVIEALTATTVSIKAHESAVIGFSVTEPDEHYYLFSFEPGSEAAVIDTMDREKPKVRITGAKAQAGTYTARMTVTDIYGLESSKELKYTILQNHAPVKVKDFEDVIFTSKAAVPSEISVEEYFKDEDGEDLKYTFSFSDPTVVNMTNKSGKFYLTPMNFGICEITVTGTDIRGEQVSQAFKVLVRDGSSELDLYPNPVRTDLFVRTGEAVQAEIKLVGATGAVFYEDVVSISPFEPKKIDMRDASAGAYTVLVKINGKELKKNIVKL